MTSLEQLASSALREPPLLEEPKLVAEAQWLLKKMIDEAALWLDP
jgi:hypothetical protein